MSETLYGLDEAFRCLEMGGEVFYIPRGNDAQKVTINTTGFLVFADTRLPLGLDSYILGRVWHCEWPTPLGAGLTSPPPKCAKCGKVLVDAHPAAMFCKACSQPTPKCNMCGKLLTPALPSYCPQHGPRYFRTTTAPTPEPDFEDWRECEFEWIIDPHGGHGDKARIRMRRAK